jgi:hypothetical protein
MTLTTHAVVGAAVASAIPNHPILGFTLAFGSHFLLDAVPHWDYPLSSHTGDNRNHMNDDMRVDKSFFRDLLKIGTDVLCGILLALLFFTAYSPHLFFIPLIGAFGAILPDALQFAYWKWRHQPLVSLQRFHLWIHAKSNFNNKPLVGVPFQMAVIVLTVLIFKFA